MKFTSIKREAKIKYGSEPIKRDLADQAIDLGARWAELNQPMGWFGDKKYKNYCKSECKKYIKANINTERAREKYGSVILVFILGAVISWVIKRILDKLFPAE